MLLLLLLLVVLVTTSISGVRTADTVGLCASPRDLAAEMYTEDLCLQTFTVNDPSATALFLPKLGQRSYVELWDTSGAALWTCHTSMFMYAAIKMTPATTDPPHMYRCHQTEDAQAQKQCPFSWSNGDLFNCPTFPMPSNWSIRAFTVSRDGASYAPTSLLVDPTYWQCGETCDGNGFVVHSGESWVCVIPTTKHDDPSKALSHNTSEEIVNGIITRQILHEPGETYMLRALNALGDKFCENCMMNDHVLDECFCHDNIRTFYILPEDDDFYLIPTIRSSCALISQTSPVPFSHIDLIPTAEWMSRPAATTLHRGCSYFSAEQKDVGGLIDPTLWKCGKKCHQLTGFLARDDEGLWECLYPNGLAGDDNENMTKLVFTEMDDLLMNGMVQYYAQFNNETAYVIDRPECAGYFRGYTQLESEPSTMDVVYRSSVDPHQFVVGKVNNGTTTCVYVDNGYVPNVSIITPSAEAVKTIPIVNCI